MLCLSTWESQLENSSYWPKNRQITAFSGGRLQEHFCIVKYDSYYTILTTYWHYQPIRGSDSALLWPWCHQPFVLTLWALGLGALLEKWALRCSVSPSNPLSSINDVPHSSGSKARCHKELIELATDYYSFASLSASVYTFILCSWWCKRRSRRLASLT